MSAGTCNSGKVLQLYKLVGTAWPFPKAYKAARAMLWAHEIHKRMSM